MVPGFLAPERVPFVDVEIVQAGERSGGVLMFERLAADPKVPVEKLERLIAMQERILAVQAKAAFFAAFAQMQGEIPVITKRGEIVVEGKVRSTFAKHEDIQRIVRPILTKYGFALRHRNEFVDGGKLKIVGILSHRAGHTEQDEFVGAADTSGSKNAIQALGSTRQYGMRYTTIALLNIASEDEDDDGVSATGENLPSTHTSQLTPAAPVQHPSGYLGWLDALRQSAMEGMPRFSAAWNEAPNAFRQRLTSTNLPLRNELKAIAQRQIVAQAS